ncbi:hypothetical protein PGTUg99_000286 [Puccinia graminis f. sp. tritici]|uniref:Uncharacterized protein n=1 Tax=Puccinia graminis f. sp. tritici TaxID=56615 RepID=A0A5B0QDL9_PUCGR|nr:hypothetical protein PGTUg99_000286 [Puccinia graminis f. sp. tritici]
MPSKRSPLSLLEPFDPTYEATDIHHIQDLEGISWSGRNSVYQATRESHLCMFMDGINPYGKSTKSASIHFVIMEPRSNRSTGSFDRSSKQLKVLWTPDWRSPELSFTPEDARVRAAILPFFADLPALRTWSWIRLSHGTRMWNGPLNLETPRIWRPDKQILRDHGVRYSVMLELPYWTFSSIMSSTQCIIFF